MRKFTFLSLLLFFLTMISCSKSDSAAVLATSNTPYPINPSQTISINDALSNLYDFINNKAGDGTRSDIGGIDYNKIVVIGGSSATKSSTSVLQIPDTLVYIVNFGNGKGAAVLAANTRLSSPVICVTESGELNPSDFILSGRKYENIEESYETFNAWLAEWLMMSIASEYCYDGGESGGDGSGNGNGNGEGNDIDYEVDEGGEGGEIDYYASGYPNYGPLITTKWGQDSPFNRLVQRENLGCVATAVSQIIVQQRPNVSMVFNGKLCDWDTMRTVHPCYYYTNPGSAEAQEQVANFCYVIQNSDNCAINANGGSTWNKAKRTFENFGFSNVRMYLDSASTTMADIVRISKRQIEQGKPVYMSACHPDDNKGHAFILDGLRHINDEWVFHINWGWNGKSDGYFAAGMFSPVYRIMQDAIDENPVEKDYVYSRNFRIITYE